MPDVVDESSAPALPPELGRLVHHIELNRSGWWDQALEKLLTATLWLSGPADLATVLGRLRQALGASVSEERAHSIVGQRIADGTILELPDGRLKVAEAHCQVLEAERRDFLALEDRVKGSIGRVFQAHALPVDAGEAWHDFDTIFLTPLLAAAGLKIYEMLALQPGSGPADASYRELLKPLCEKYGDEIRAALVDFIDPSDVDVRSYLLRRLSAQFAREGAALDGAALGAISSLGARPGRATVFLDTNFVLSLLGLHFNPSNDVAAELLDLITRVKGQFDVRLYVLPATVEELRRVLREVIGRLSGVVLTAKVAMATGPIHSSGLVDRFIEASRTSPSRLTADDFFGPYEANPVTFLRERGVEVFQDPILETLTTDPKVVDDFHELEERQRQFRPRGVKPYDANMHDLVLWHFAKLRRPRVIESPFDAQYWIATMDYGLIGFDRRKRSNPPIALTPSDFIHILQFWVPRDDVLDAALVGSIREPLLFVDFDKSAEAVSLRILGQLSRYEHAEDLSGELLSRVLRNDALRARLANAPSAAAAQEAAMIEDAFADEAQRLLEEQQAALARETQAIESRALLEQEARRQQVEFEQTSRGQQTELDRLHESQEAQATELAALKSQRAEDQTRWEAEQQRLNSAAAKAQQDAEREHQLRVVVVTTVPLVLGAAALGALTLWLGSLSSMRTWVSILSATVLFAIVVFGTLGWVVGRQSHLRDGRFATSLHNWRRWLIAGVAAIALNLVATAIWQSGDSSPKPSPSSATTASTTSVP